MIRLLIADNQPEWRRFSQEVLSQQGYDVVMAEDVETLKRLLKANGYDLILVNIELMKREFQKPFHELFMSNVEKPIVVVAMPGWGPRVVQETREAFKAGAKDCVDKPLSPDRLLSLVRQLLEEFSGRLFSPPQGVQQCHS